MITRSLNRIVGIFAAMCLFATVGWATEGVSPGAADRLAVIESRCPTFSWEATPGAERFELVVYRLDADAPILASIKLTSDNEVLYTSISGRAMAWTPEAADCFAPGDSYGWFVRAVTDADTGEGSEWSQPRFFEVAAAPSADELERAVEVLRRWEAANGDASPMLSSAAAPAAASIYFPDTGSGTGLESTHLKSVITGTAAIRGEQTDFTGETYGVVGVSASPDGAGIGASNVTGGPDLVLDGAVPAEISEAGIDRSSASAQTFSFTNTGGGGMMLDIDGVEVVTTQSDLDSLGALSCGSGQIAKWTGSAWECLADEDTVLSESQVDAFVADNGYGDITAVTTAAGSGLTGGSSSGNVALGVSGVTSAMITDGTITGSDISTSTTISATDFTYSSVRTGYAFISPLSCKQYNATAGAVDEDFYFKAPPSNTHGPFLQLRNAEGAGTFNALCRTDIPVPPTSTVNITGATLIFADNSAACLVGGGLKGKHYPTSVTSDIASVYSGISSSDLATMVGYNQTKTFPAFAAYPVTQSATSATDVFFDLEIEQNASSAEYCRFIGVQLAYTVNKP